MIEIKLVLLDCWELGPPIQNEAPLYKKILKIKRTGGKLVRDHCIFR